MSQELLILGWREWISLPKLGVPRIKAKVDTGARTSTLHAFSVRGIEETGKVLFTLHPRKHSKKTISCMADIWDIRWVTDSGGHRELRYVIKTEILLGSLMSTIEITLTSREDMRFRMLLGRTALKNLFIVNPTCSYLLGKP